MGRGASCHPVGGALRDRASPGPRSPVAPEVPGPNVGLPPPRWPASLNEDDLPGAGNLAAASLRLGNREGKRLMPMRMGGGPLLAREIAERDALSGFDGGHEVAVRDALPE